jgi:hypothetical protein
VANSHAMCPSQVELCSCDILERSSCAESFSSLEILASICLQQGPLICLCLCSSPNSWAQGLCGVVVRTGERCNSVIGALSACQQHHVAHTKQYRKWITSTVVTKRKQALSPAPGCCALHS